jgi:hypothetical protein
MPPNRARASVFALALSLATFLPATNCATAAEAKTSKERLSSKAADEQRVDNCRVPLDRRGTVPRPDCAGEAETAPPVAPSEPHDNPSRR